MESDIIAKYFSVTILASSLLFSFSLFYTIMDILMNGRITMTNSMFLLLLATPILVHRLYSGIDDFLSLLVFIFSFFIGSLLGISKWLYDFDRIHPHTTELLITSFILPSLISFLYSQERDHRISLIGVLLADSFLAFSYL